ncbi:glycine zipper 2TM domain-containing protein [Sphingomonadaceae bacterium jetA1]|uniref:glycine zipper 2TM domain-containing protein n=1 Tax=Facivitalis istanbulensis TaxID=3075838 RepID=UPI003493BC48
MKAALFAAMAVMTVAAPIVATPAVAQSRDGQWQGDRDNWEPSRDYRRGDYRERRLGRDDKVFRGRDGRTYCKRNDGTTGLVVGAVGGGVLGNVIGGGTLGTLLGAGGGALLGRSIDRGKVRCR